MDMKGWKWEVIVDRRRAGEWMLGGSGQAFQEQWGMWVKAEALQTCWQWSWVSGNASGPNVSLLPHPK